MKTALDCIPCLVRQTVEAVRFVAPDSVLRERLVREALAGLAALDFGESPVFLAQRVHRILRALTGVADPYAAVKARFNRLALDMLPLLRADLRAATDPLALALRLAIAGNVIDFGVNGNPQEADIQAAIGNTLNESFAGDIEAFRAAVSEASTILYLADNAGELVFDRLLIEQLPYERVVVVVRGQPILNDATHADAAVAGLHELVEVIDNGSDAPGTLLADCADHLRQRFAKADLIIAKGQGNYETLSDVSANIWFLLKVKCPVVAEHIGLPVGTHVARRRQVTAVTEAETLAVMV